MKWAMWIGEYREYGIGYGGVGQPMGVLCRAMRGGWAMSYGQAMENGITNASHTRGW